MILFPAIDLKENTCVRLKQGLMDTYKTYGDDPVSVAKKFEIDGASYLHVVDLDKAIYSISNNIKSIKSIRETLKIPIQVGGGIKTLEDVRTLLNLGINRVIIGTIAVSDFELLKEMVEIFKNQIIVSIDAKDGFVATKGWQEISSIDTLDLCKKLESIGIKTIIYTDISKDGMLLGPNFKDYQRLKENTNLDIIASGGISSLSDLIHLKKLNLYGAIIGKALYENRFTLKEAQACLQNASFPV
jgi:phosphoribosylformimino-5-aminoimidazole carboxamide ribotide isomerase